MNATTNIPFVDRLRLTIASLSKEQEEKGEDWSGLIDRLETTLKEEQN